MVSEALRTSVGDAMNRGVETLRSNKSLSWLIGAVMLVVIGICDKSTGPDLPLAPFYLIPTAYVAWNIGRIPGFSMATLSSVCWLAVELAWRRKYSLPLAPYWTALLQLGVSIFSAGLTAAVSEREQKLKVEVAVRKQAEAELNHVNSTLERRVAERSAAAEKRAEDLARSEAAVRHRTGILKSILTNMGEAVVVTDTTGVIRLFNPAAARLLEIEPGGADASEWSDRFELSLSERLEPFAGAQPALASALRGAPVDGLELSTHQGKKTETAWLSMTARLLGDDLEGPHGVVFVFSDITARKEMEKLAANVSEWEKQRIGQDLHDGLGQHLVSTEFAARFLKDRLAEKGLSEAAAAQEIAELLNNAISQSRDLARGLFPVKLEEEGLFSALEELAGNITRNSHVACRFQSHPSVLVYDPIVASNLYRLVQEAATNALKHAGPTSIVIRLEQRGATLTLTVVNDGRPFVTPKPGNPGMGLRIMHYRAGMIGAELDIRPGPDGGTIMQCSAPNLKRRKNEYDDAQGE
jgi:signal transduction histidine kinase